ncbi:MAG: site-specific DNA-methyltransferase [Planctomycetia bacterium]|nr:site-specific DNA-methyltransferase [Planctomycetia bacterium]
MMTDTIHCQDCIEGMKELPDGCIDLAFADPPFNIGYKYDLYEDKRSPNDYLKWCKSWLDEIYRVLKPNGTFWLAIGDEYAAELKILATRNMNFKLRNWVIWYYTFGVHCAHKFTRSHTHLLYLVKDEKNFTFNDSEIRVPSARQLIYNDLRANPVGRIPDDTWILRPQDASDAFGDDESVWFFSRVCGTFKERQGAHGCQMPELLMERIIRVSSNAGDLVLDPFFGTATTLYAAKKLHRKYLGFEISQNYCDLAKERLEQMPLTLNFEEDNQAPSEDNAVE